MKTLIIVVLIVALLFLFFVQAPTQEQEEEVVILRDRPVYIDHPTEYLNEPILYSEWNQEISSSL
jgi:hypothetical protein